MDVGFVFGLVVCALIFALFIYFVAVLIVYALASDSETTTTTRRRMDPTAMYPVRVPPPRLTTELHYDMEATVAVVDGEKLSEITNNCTECVICLDGIGADEEGEIRVLLCGHRFHAACINEWLIKYGSFCPTCRRPACGTIGILVEQCMV